MALLGLLFSGFNRTFLSDRLQFVTHPMRKFSVHIEISHCARSTRFCSGSHIMPHIITNKEASTVLCSVVNHAGSGRARKKCRWCRKRGAILLVNQQRQLVCELVEQTTISNRMFSPWERLKVCSNSACNDSYQRNRLRNWSSSCQFTRCYLRLYTNYCSLLKSSVFLFFYVQYIQRQVVPHWKRSVVS